MKLGGEPKLLHENRTWENDPTATVEQGGRGGCLSFPGGRVWAQPNFWSDALAIRSRSAENMMPAPEESGRWPSPRDGA